MLEAVNGLPPGVSAIYFVPEGYLSLTELPAQIHFSSLAQSREIQQSSIDILDQYTQL